MLNRLYLIFNLKRTYLFNREKPAPNLQCQTTTAKCRRPPVSSRFTVAVAQIISDAVIQRAQSEFTLCAATWIRFCTVCHSMNHIWGCWPQHWIWLHAAFKNISPIPRCMSRRIKIKRSCPQHWINFHAVASTLIIFHSTNHLRCCNPKITIRVHTVCSNMNQIPRWLQSIEIDPMLWANINQIQCCAPVGQH
jgi:hypothetical protein